ncbi:MAG: glycosyltransferase [Verrucomicrobiota bacterium]
MARVAFLSPEVAGHLFPSCGLALELQKRGHQTTLYALKNAQPHAEKLGVPFQEVLPRDGFTFCRDTRTEKLNRTLGPKFQINLREKFIKRVDLHLNTTLTDLKSAKPDALIYDQNILAGSTIAEILNIPCASVSAGMHWTRELDIPPQFTKWSYTGKRRHRLRNLAAYGVWDSYMREALQNLNHHRRRHALCPFKQVESTLSPMAHIAQSCKAFDFPYARLPDHFHYGGSLAAYRAPGNLAFPWNRLDDRPVVFASMGTVRSSRRLSLYQIIAEACAPLNAQLVMTTGAWDQEGITSQDLARLPGEPVIVDYAPQIELLAKSDAFISHVGFNSACEGMMQGVPIAALPQTGDQPAIASRLAHCGAGINLGQKNVNAEKLSQAIDRLLTEARFKNAAGRIKEAMLATGGAPQAAAFLEARLGL